MEKIKTHLHSFLKCPNIYDAVQTVVGAKKQKKIILNYYLDLQPHLSLLDLGSGTSDILSLFKASTVIAYTGVDINSDYISKAKIRYQNRGNFVCSDIVTFSDLTHYKESFDVCLMSGFIHHLDDEQASLTLKCAKKCLKNNGKLVLIDPVYHQNQSFFSHFFVGLDRGCFVRQESNYKRLVQQFFKNTRFEIRRDLLHIPYSNIVTVAVKS